MSVKSSPNDGRWDHMRKSLRSCPSWGPFYLTPPAHGPLQFFAPAVRASCAGSEERAVPLACELTSSQTTAQLLRAVRQERASSHCGFSSLLPAAEQVWWLRCRYWIRPTCCRTSERGRDVPAPKCHHWGKAYQPCTQRAKLHRSVWALNPLRHSSPPPGRCSTRICQTS